MKKTFQDYIDDIFFTVFLFAAIPVLWILSKVNPNFFKDDYKDEI